FAGNRIDRQSESRSDDSVAVALADPSARLLLLGGGRLFVKEGQGRFDCRFTLAESETHQARIDEAILLGLSDDGPVLAAPCALDADDLPPAAKAFDYRSVYTQGLVDDEA